MTQGQKSSFEFIALMASLMAMAALAIDAILPAMSTIGEVIGISNSQDNQLLITMIFLGLGFGQLIFGPLSDSFGRKPLVYFGFLIRIVYYSRVVYILVTFLLFVSISRGIIPPKYIIAKSDITIFTDKPLGKGTYGEM